MANKMVIAGSDNVTAKQLKEFMNQVDQRIITGPIIQNLLDHARLFSVQPIDLRLRTAPLLFLIKKKDWPTKDSSNLSQADFVLPLFDFKIWKELIMYTVKCTRLYIEELDRRGGHSSYVEYYRECWENLDAAKDDVELNEAVAFLGLTIFYQ